MKNILLCCKIALLFCLPLSAQTMKAKMSVNVTIAGVPASEVTRISAAYFIDESGYISLPLLNNPVKLSGLSASSAAKKLASVYKSAEIYSSPIFLVTSALESESEKKIAREFERLAAEKQRIRDEKRIESDVVFVEGDANKPGEYRLTHGMNIGILLVKCGGDAEFGSEERVILKRNGVATEYNYVKDKRVKDIALKPGDFIEIPKGRGFFGKK